VIEANGLRFHLVDEGQGDPVVLLHGFPDTSRLWRGQIPELVRAGHRVIAPDLRGRGLSQRPLARDDYALAKVVEDVIAILGVLGIERASVVGHDFGAAVAWLLASFHPERVERLVALSVGFPGAGGRPRRDALERGWYRLLFLFEEAEELLKGDDWYLARELLQGYRDLDRCLEEFSVPEALAAGLSWYRANLPVSRLLHPAPALPPVRAPTLGIWSTGDRHLTEDGMLASAGHVSGPWRYERIEGASHWIPLDAAERLNALLLEFLGLDTYASPSIGGSLEQ